MKRKQRMMRNKYCKYAPPAAADRAFCCIRFLAFAVFLFAVFAAVDLFFLIGEDKYVGQSLLNGSDASGVAAFDDVFDLFGKYQFLLLYDLTVFDDVDGDVVVDEGQDIQIQHIDVTFYFQNVFFAHFSAAGVFDDSNGAV